MIEKPRVIIRPGTAPVAEKKEFLFGNENLRMEGLSSAVQDYRQRAWETYKRSAFPDQNTDSWKRSNLERLLPLQVSNNFHSI